MHLRKLLLILAFLPSLLCMGRKEEKRDTISARRAFVEMPSGVLDMLPKMTRMDMLDYYDTDSIWKAPNNLEGTSFLKQVAPDFLAVQLTPVTELQLKVLRLKNGKEILMTIYNTGLPGEIQDSELGFYDAAFNPLPTEKYFPNLKIEDFFDTKGYKTKMEEIREILPFYAFCYSASAGSSDVSVRLTYQDLLTVEDTKIVEMFLRPEVVYKWNGNKFSNKQLQK